MQSISSPVSTGKLSIANQRTYVLIFLGIIIVYELGYNMMMSHVIHRNDNVSSCDAGGDSSNNPYCAEVRLFQQWRQAVQQEQAQALAQEKLDLQLLLQEEEKLQPNDATTVGAVNSTEALKDKLHDTEPTTAPAVVNKTGNSPTDLQATAADLQAMHGLSTHLIHFELPGHATGSFVDDPPEEDVDLNDHHHHPHGHVQDVLGEFTEVVARLAMRAKAFREETAKWKEESKIKKGGQTAWAKGLQRSMEELEQRKQKMLKKREAKVSPGEQLATRIKDLHLELCLEPHRWEYPSCKRVLEQNGYVLVDGELESEEDDVDEPEDAEDGDLSHSVEETRRKLCEQPDHKGFPECTPAASTSVVEESSEFENQMSGGFLNADHKGIAWKAVKYWSSRWWSKANRQPVTVGKTDLAHAHWSGMLPKVVCVSVLPSARSARYRLTYFVNAFRLQNYEGPHELVLVYRADDQQAANLVNRFADGSYIRGIPAQGNETLPSTMAYRFGAWAVSQPGAGGAEADAPDVIAEWDFDAWHHPDRLRMQVRSLGVAGRPVSILQPEDESSTTTTKDAHQDLRLSAGSITGEAEWMRKHWYPLLDEGAPLLQSAEAGHVVKVTMPELLVYSNSSSA
mmetsp:Transcript_16020/g.36715  ORF Transcript_16020/g.36715 Transcript_16020/m.36715 type:complete len:625 (+) Transcript_16020:116-1990(+)